MFSGYDPHLANHNKDAAANTLSTVWFLVRLQQLITHSKSIPVVGTYIAFVDNEYPSGYQ